MTPGLFRCVSQKAVGVASFDEVNFISEFQRRPEHAFKMLMAGFRDRVFTLCLRVTPGPAEAEDLAQESFLRVWKGLANFRGESSLSTWIYHIVWNVCASHLERKGRSLDTTPYREEDGDEGEPHFSVSTEDEAYKSFEDRQFIGKLFDGLSASHKMVLTLFYLEEQSYEEIATVTGWPMGTVKATLHRAKDRLRTLAFAEKAYSEQV